MKHAIICLLLLGGVVALSTTEANALVSPGTLPLAPAHASASAPSDAHANAVKRVAANIERHSWAAELDEPRRLRHSTQLRPLSYIGAIIDSDASPGIDG